jgi:hypothetical protein
MQIENCSICFEIDAGAAQWNGLWEENDENSSPPGKLMQSG